MSTEYLLNRDTSETQRLKVQHELYAKNLGYLIKPSIAAHLPATASIADIGTGTGAWASAVATELPSSTLTGFDISDAQFPPASSLPTNVTLKLHDLRHPFPDNLKGTFDLVHLRLLCLALPDQQAWTAAARNAATLLKPGGWLQWEESDFETIKRIARAHAHSTTAALRTAFRRMIAMTNGMMVQIPEKLEQAFEDAALGEVDVDVVTSERVPEMREVTMQIGIGACEGVHKQARSNPVVSAKMPGTVEDDEKLIQGMREDAASGGYGIFYIHCVTGRKAA